MQLKMVVGSLIIDSVPVSDLKLMDEAYLIGLKTYLQERNSDLFLHSNESVSYFIDEVPSKVDKWMNERVLW